MASVMKRIFTLLTLCLLASAVWAVDVTFVAGVDNGNSPGTGGPFSIVKDGVTVQSSNGLANATQYRFYKNSTLTICAETGEIIKIVFECTANGTDQYGPGNFMPNVGSYSYIEKVGVWEGRSQCVTFTAATNQVRATRITVIVDGGNVGAPVISPASGAYYEPIEVAITCPVADAVIHYTTDGSDPDEQSPVYTAPFNVDHDMTVKAVAVVDGEMSNVVAADYRFVSISAVVNCFEDLENMDDDATVSFSSPIYAVAQHNRYLYVKDGCGGYGLIYGDVGQTYNTGDVIPAGFIVTKSFYSGEMELTRPVNFKPATGSVVIEPEKITPSQAGHSMFGHYVMVENVTIIEENGAYYAVDSSGNRLPVYFNSLGVSPPIDLSKHYDIFGVIGSYGKDPVYQLLPTKLVSYPEPGPGIGLGNYWKYIDPVNPPESITLECDATVILQTGHYLYAMDETGYGLIYGDVGQTYSHGDVFPAGFSGKPTIYDGNPELTGPLNGFQPSTEKVEVVPEEVKIPQVTLDLWAHYVIIKGVIIDPEKSVIRDQDGNELPIYIRPGLPFTYPEDLSRLIDIRGIVTSYRGNIQLLVWDLPKDPPPAHCLQDVYQLENTNTPFILQLIVIYQNGVNLYVQDKCGDFMLMYGNCGGPFVNGDIIEGRAQWTRYQNQRQLMPIGDWEKVGHTSQVEPEDIDCTIEATHEMCHWFVRFENVAIVTEDGKTYIEDECGRLVMYNRFGIAIPGDPVVPPSNPYDLNEDGEVNIADINFLINLILSDKIMYDWFWHPQGGDDDTFDISGFLTVYQNELELYPVQIWTAGTAYGIIGDLNHDGELGIADLNDLIDRILSQKPKGLSNATNN